MLRRELKDAATAAFRDNTQLLTMSLEDRIEAPAFYDKVAKLTIGRHAHLAMMYNRERARFLRGEVDRIAATALEFRQAANPDSVGDGQ